MVEYWMKVASAKAKRSTTSAGLGFITGTTEDLLESETYHLVGSKMLTQKTVKR